MYPSVVLLLVCPVVAAGRTVASWADFCGLTAHDFMKLDRGEAIGRVLPGKGPGEIGILGAVRLRANKEAVRVWYSDARNFKDSKVVLAAGEFHNPPGEPDVAGYALTADDIAALGRCRPGNCGLKLTAGEMERFAAAPGKENEVAGSILLEMARGYFQQGDAALAPYHDHKVPVDRVEAYRNLLSAGNCVLEAFPGLAGNSPEQENLFWSVERYGFGLKALLNVTHARMFRPSPEVLVVWAKQVRASHYYEGSLALTVVLDAPGGGAYMVYVNRSRVDLLAGILKGWKRALVERYAPGSVRREVARIGRSIERVAAELR
ncbi:MAG: hypothetical protein SFV51_02395 [Bryobacteraceae bacterium]|nr:hypothetical protein [Bryobacteraceae bacterium]